MKEWWVDTSATDYFVDGGLDFTGSLKDDITLFPREVLC